MDNVALEFQVECVVLASGGSIPLKRAAEILGVPPQAVAEAAARLNERNLAEGRSFTIQHRGSLLVAHTLPAFSGLVRRMREGRRELSPALLETLAVVAYRQPLTRAEVEALRGADSAHALGRLLELGLIKTSGRAQKPGRPLLYRTTDLFLVHFGLSSLQDLPTPEELRQLMEGTGAPRAMGVRP